MSTQVSEQQARQVAEAAREQDWKLPSFGKELFLGNFRLDLIHPQPSSTPRPWRRARRSWASCARSSPSTSTRSRSSATSKIPDAAIDGLKQLGALGMKVPEQYGGLGLSQVYYNKALALAGTWHSSLATLLSAHQSIGVAEPLMLFGSDEQKQKWLPLVAKDHISAFLLTEPDVGSDPARLGSTATPTEGGYLLNGRKLWATNGAIADIVVVMAQVPKGVDGHRGGISAFVLDYTTDGVTVESRNAFMGLRGIENSVTRARGRLRPGGEPDRQGGPWASRSPSPRSTRAASRCRRSASATPSGRPRSRASGPRSASSGASRSASTTPSRRRSPTSPRPRSAWRRCSTSPPAWPTTRRTTSASRPRSRSSTRPRTAGRCSTT